jgi:predicted metal-binding membrane protein
MLPTLVPTLTTYESLMRPGLGTRGGWLGLIGGYLAVWLGIAGVFAAAQGLLAAAGVVDDLGAAGSRAAAGALLAGAGLWQFTRAKEVCQSACLSPMGWFLGRWRPGFAGGARMGAGLGLYCVGCCWAYMALGFVGGTMNLLWMGIATVLMVLEKLPDIGLLVVRPVGVLMIAAGVAWGVF